MTAPVRLVTREQLDAVMSELTAVTKGETPIYCSPDVFELLEPGNAEDGKNPDLLAYSPVLPPLSAFAILELESGEGDVHGFSFTVADKTHQCAYAYAAEAYYDTWRWFQEHGPSTGAPGLQA